MAESIYQLTTEQKNPHSEKFDTLSTLDMLTVMNKEDHSVAEAVRPQLKSISKVIDVVYHLVKRGGRLIYIGAGTSGRLGILDASECPPTFGVSSNLVQAVMAGGDGALKKAVEGAEDDGNLAVRDLKKIVLSNQDFLIGLTSSGRTPYVLAALNYASSKNVKTGCIACVSGSEIGKIVDYPIEVVTGPEIIAGSTRLKAGSAQKFILNMISTCLMTKLGKVYDNYMIDVVATNDKLLQRALHMLVEILGVNEKEAVHLLEASHFSVKIAIVMYHMKVSYEEAEKLLKLSAGKLRTILNDP